MAKLTALLTVLVLIPTLMFSATSACETYVEAVAALRAQVANFQQAVTYTHWGSGDCGNSSSLVVYSGFIGGSYYKHKGGGAEYLCLPNDPEYSTFIPGYQAKATLHSGVLRTEKFFEPFKALSDGTPKCSLCSVPSATTQVMIPAKKSCPSDWKLIYQGYLMTAHHEHQRTQHVCVDSVKLEIVANSQSEDRGARMYLTEASDNSEIRHPPYVEEKELTCVVCAR